MAIKLSELKTTVDGIRGQVQKIWNEQQTKYSELQEKWAKLNAQLENQDLADDVATDLKEFAEELQKFDDSIPDLTS